MKKIILLFTLISVPMFAAPAKKSAAKPNTFETTNVCRVVNARISLSDMTESRVSR
jgi:hypothetical protein